jgi:hypothetical protein
MKASGKNSTAIDRDQEVADKNARHDLDRVERLRSREGDRPIFAKLSR